MDSTGFSDSLLSEWFEAFKFWMLFTNPDFIAFEMFLFQNAHDLPPTPFNPEYLQEVVLATPPPAQGVTPDPPPSHTPNPPSLLPEAAAPVQDETNLRAVCSASTPLPLLIPPPQDAALLPSGWHKIPQEVYDHGGKQWDYTRSGCVTFEVTGRPGMNARAALQKRFSGLVGRDDLVLQDTGNVISCRLKFPGYPPNSSIQIPTKRWNKTRDPITRSDLVYQLAKRLKEYLDDMAQGPHGTAPWKIGEGFMHLDNMYLARLESASKGSMQPEIWVVDPTL